MRPLPLELISILIHALFLVHAIGNIDYFRFALAFMSILQ